MSQPFQVGGSVSPHLSVYISREADETLYNALTEGELCYVFNSRQMGKSSLLLNVKNRLMLNGLKCCFIDISRIGSVNIAAEQWYAGIISELWRGFGLPPGKALVEWWTGLGDLPAPHKLSLFLEEKLIETFPNDEFVLFFDEVDSVLSLPFAADDFFSVMRACYNRRADIPALTKVKFALFGVAVPSDLVQETSRSPFNIGKAISLEGFTAEEALPFSEKLPFSDSINRQLLTRILYWSNGQPFLTQKLCQLVETYAEKFQHQDCNTWLDKLIQVHVLDNWESHDNPEHLRTIKDRILLDQQYGTQVLVNYLRVLQAKEQTVEETELEDFNRLYLTGLVAGHGEKISPRTKIYRTIFDETWVEQQLNNQRPYGQKISLWREGNCQDSQWLLQGQELEQAKVWASSKILPDIDHRYLTASQDMVNDQVKAWNDKLQAEIIQRKEAQQQLIILNTAIEKAKQEAEDANKAKSDFLARVSHEVRTHINSVLGLTYIAQKGEYNQSSRRHLKKINRAGKYMLGVVDDIVDIHRVEKGELALTCEPFYLDDVIDRLVDTIGFAVNEKGLALFLNMPKKPLPAIIGDPKRLEQLLVNLISNAIKHTVEGAITLSVDVLSGSINDESDLLELSFGVLDTGIGISENSIAGTIDLAQNDSVELGIGLRLCCELSELMNGQITVNSAANQGSQFTFSCSFKQSGQSYKTPVCQQVYIQHDSQSLAIIEGMRALGHHVDCIDVVDSFNLLDNRPSVLLFNAITFSSQSALLDLIESAPQIKLLPIVNLGEQLPHWLQVLGIEHMVEYPCTMMKLDKHIQQCFEDKTQTVVDISARIAKSIRVLVAEDDEINQQVIKELLTSLGCQVQLVSNGYEAVKSAMSEPFDIVFMDIEMPRMNGLEAVEKIRAKGKDAELQHLLSMPIVAMTAHALIDDKKRFIKAGMNDHIAKPLEPNIVFEVIKEWLPLTQLQSSFSSDILDSDVDVQIRGIDTKAGLTRCNGNLTLYTNILNQFAEKHNQGLSFDGLDVFQITKLAHAVKGSAANLGASKISNIAAEIETLGRKGVVANDELLNHFSSKLMLLSQDINIGLNKMRVTTGTEKLAAQKIIERLTDFISVVDEDHGEAGEIMAELLPYGDQQVKAIGRAMDVFDTDSAKALAQEWIKTQSN